MLTRALAARLLRRDLGGAWRIANGGGSHGNTRLAASADRRVVIKLGQAAGALRRLAELDWDEIDLSDPWRGGGVQLCWHAPEPRWTDFTAALGATPDRPLAARVLWWAAFRALRNGYWIDSRGGTAWLVENAGGFAQAMTRLRSA
jgi:hypothetical protein